MGLAIEAHAKEHGETGQSLEENNCTSNRILHLLIKQVLEMAAQEKMKKKNSEPKT